MGDVINNELQADPNSFKQEKHAMKENFKLKIVLLENYDSRIGSLKVVVQSLKASIDSFLQQQQRISIMHQKDEASTSIAQNHHFKEAANQPTSSSVQFCTNNYSSFSITI